MSEIVPTLFGLSPEAFKQQRQDRVDERAVALAQLDPFQRASFNIQRGADRLAGVVGGMLGGQDPELQRRTQAQQIMGMIDPADPDTFFRAAEMALQGGDQRLALGLRQEGEKARQGALVRSDQERVRQGLRAKDAKDATAFINKQALEATVRGAIVPGTPAQQQFVEVDEQGQPVAIPGVPASFDLESIRAELLQTEEGRKKLEELEKLTRPEEFNLGDRRFRRKTDGTLEEVVSASSPKTQAPAMVAEFNFARSPEGGGFKGTFQQFVTARAAAGRAPAAPRPEPQPQPPVAVIDSDTGKQILVSRDEALSRRMTPAAGGEGISPKEMQRRNAAFPQATSNIQGIQAKSVEFINDLRALRNHPGLSSISGIAAGRLPGITAEGRAAQALYDKVLAKGGFQELQEMRDASKTGGALGSVSNIEGQQLRASFAAIDRKQDAPDVRKALDEAIAGIEKSTALMRNAYDLTYEYKNDTPTRLNPQDAEALNWANSNPEDPRAAQIKQRLGVK